MPRRTDIEKILLIGSGPIVIGQAAEFDYSGVQACKVLREEGYEIILVNSNPATIMTDPEFADRTYVEPLLPDSVARIIERDRPDALLPTLGGQTALNLAKDLHDQGVLEKYGVELIGADYDAIHRAEDREAFRQTMEDAGLRVPWSRIVTSVAEVERGVAAGEIELPAIVRPAFTLGGQGGGVGRTQAELAQVVSEGLAASPINQVLVEESVLGWGEFELEVMRDHNDNVVIICSIENVDPMGVHTGDSVTVAPAQTLTDHLYQELRDQAIRVIRAVGVETGGSNVQFAVNPETGEIVVIEMNPRVSRSSALASKATGFPIAKIAARLAVGYALEEIPNDITEATPASFEPTIDYVVTKMPRFAFEKFPGSEGRLTTHMKSVGEAMSIGRTFGESFAKAMRSRELDSPAEIPASTGELLERLEIPSSDRFDLVDAAFKRGVEVDEVHRRTDVDLWFLRELQHARLRRRRDGRARPDLSLGRHMRGRVRGPHAVLLLDPRARGERLRGPSRRPRFRRHPRRRAEPDRPGHRVRLLLRPRRDDRARIGSRRGHDQLQPRDGLDRLRHLRPPLLRAAHGRGRARRLRAGGARGSDRPVRRPDAAAPRQGSRGRRDPAARNAGGRDRPRRGSRPVRRPPAPAGDQAPALRDRALGRGSPGDRRRRRLPAPGPALIRARRSRDGDLLLERGARGLSGGQRQGRPGAPPLPRPLPRGRDRGRRRRAFRRHQLPRRRRHATRRGGRGPLRGLRLRAAADEPGRGDARRDPHDDGRRSRSSWA